MEPRLYEGDRVRLEAPLSRPPRCGDVALVLTSTGALRLHRLFWPLVGTRRSSWRSIPDVGAISDGPVEVLAVVTEAPRPLGGLLAGITALSRRIVVLIREGLRR